MTMVCLYGGTVESQLCVVMVVDSDMSRENVNYEHQCIEINIVQAIKRHWVNCLLAGWVIIPCESLNHVFIQKKPYSYHLPCFASKSASAHVQVLGMADIPISRCTLANLARIAVRWILQTTEKLKWHLLCLWISYHESPSLLGYGRGQEQLIMSFTWAPHIAASVLTWC